MDKKITDIKFQFYDTVSNAFNDSTNHVVKTQSLEYTTKMSYYGNEKYDEAIDGTRHSRARGKFRVVLTVSYERSIEPAIYRDLYNYIANGVNGGHNGITDPNVDLHIFPSYNSGSTTDNIAVVPDSMTYKQMVSNTISQFAPQMKFVSKNLRDAIPKWLEAPQ